MKFPTARDVGQRAREFALSVRARRMAMWLAGLALLVGIAGFLIAPPIIKQKLETALTAQLHRKTTIESVSINPFALSITLRGLHIREKDLDADAISVGEFYASASTMSLFRWAPVLNRVRIVRPRISIVRNADLSYNYQDLIDEFAAKPAGPTPGFSLNNIEVADGAIDFDDRPEQQKHEIREIKAGIPFLSSLPYATDIEVQPSLSMRLDGGQFAITGETLPFENTRQTTLNIDVDALQLPRFAEYSPVPLKFKLAAGELATHLKLAFALANNKPAALTLSGEIRLGKLDIRDLAGAPVLALPSLALDIERLDALRDNVRIKSLRAAGLEAHVTRLKSGTLNIMNLLPASPAPTQNTGKPATARNFSVAEVQLTQGTLYIEDRIPATAFRTVLNDIALTLHGVSNAQGAKAVGSLNFKGDALDAFTVSGDLQVAPLHATGKLSASGLKLAALRPYYDGVVNVKIAQGTLDIATTFDAAFDAGTLAASVSGLEATLKSLQINAADGRTPLARVGLFAIKGGDADLAKRGISVAELSGSDAVATVLRGAAGGFNWSGLANVPAAAPVENAPAPAEIPPWSVAVKKVALDNLGLEYRDASQRRPVKSRITQLSLDADELSNAVGGKGRINIRGTVNKAGRLLLTGTAGLNPVSLNLKIDSTGVDLLPLQPLVEDRLNIAITGGALSAKGTLTVEAPPGAPVRVAYKGSAKVVDFASVDRLSFEDLLQWKTLALAGIDATSSPLKAVVGEIALSDFYSRLVVNPDGVLNVQRIIRKPGETDAEDTPQPTTDVPGAETPAAAVPAAATATPAPQATAAPGAPVSARDTAQDSAPVLAIGKITLARGIVNFTDRFIKPNYSADLSDVGGSVGRITRDTAGEVELHGFVQKTAPLAITGSINPLARDLFLDIKADAKNVELPPLTAYAIRYAGYGIEKGKLSMDVKYHIENRKLTAENHINLDQLTFGDKVDSPTATKLPVLLAVSLLKDRNGVIDINLPVSGSLDDPQFSMGGIIVRVIVNLFVKAVTSPFALIGSMFGGGEELAYVEFAPGRAVISPDAEKKLANIAKALTERPALKMEISGRADAASDRDALRQVELERKLKAQKLKALLKAGDAAASLDQVKVETGEYEKYLTAAYKEEKFSKPKNLIGMAKGLPPPEMEKLMLANAAASDDDLRALAIRRAQSVEDWLTQSGKIPVDRVFLLAPRLSAEGIKDKGTATRADFSLR